MQHTRWFTLLTVLRRWSRSLSYSLLLCGLFYEAICCMSFRVSFCSYFFSPFSIAITSLGEEKANLSTFRTFARFVIVWICRFPLPPWVWERLWFVIVALPRLFFYLLFRTREYNRHNTSGNTSRQSEQKANSHKAIFRSSIEFDIQFFAFDTYKLILHISCGLVYKYIMYISAISYHMYPTYSDTSTPYHTCSKI